MAKEGITIYSQECNGKLTELYVGDLTLWFSYTTIVAFAIPGVGRRVCENVWSQTTGRHLNEIDNGNKAGRLPRAQFEKELAVVQEQLNTTLASVAKTLSMDSVFA